MDSSKRKRARGTLQVTTPTVCTSNVRFQQQLDNPATQQHNTTNNNLQQLPEALLTQIVLQGGTQRHLHGVLAAVCQEWRRVLLQNTTQLAVGLTSARGATALAAWLAQHAAGLEQLNMVTVGLFGRHCDNNTRLQLFQALHEAVAAHRDAAAAAAAADVDDQGGDDSEDTGGAAAAAAASGIGMPHVNNAKEVAEAAAAAAEAAAATGDMDAAAGAACSTGVLADGSVSPRDCSPKPPCDAPPASRSDGWSSSSDSSSSSSSSSSESESEQRPHLAWGYGRLQTPQLGGMLGGCDHVLAPSTTEELLAAAAAAASAGEAEAAAAAAAGDDDRGCRAQAVAAEASNSAQKAAQHSLQQPPPLTPGDSQQHHHHQQQQQQQQQQHSQMQLQPAPRRPQQHLRLQQLSANMRLTPADCAAIASLPAPHLVRLELQGSRTRRLGIDGVRALAAMTQLTGLKMQQLGIGDDATVLLAQGLTGLLQLSLSGNNIGPSGAAAIAQHCSKLQQLDLSINRIKGSGLVALCGALACLTELHLAGNPGFDAASLQQLQQLTALSHLTMSSSGLCNQGLAAISAALPQLEVLDAGNNRLSKVDALTALVSLTSLNLSRNPLQLNCSKVLAGLPLRSLALFDAAPARGVSHLAGRALTSSLTALTLGCDPSTHTEGADEALPLAKTRTCSTLFGALAEAGQLQMLSVPCTGLGDAQGKMLAKLAGSLRVLNISYNCLTPSGLRVLADLPLLERLELRAMRPELNDDVAVHIRSCTRLTHLDLAHNDITSVGVKQLGCSALSRLQHLDLRNNAQVEKWSVLAAAAHLTQLTFLNLLEVSDVSARAYPRPTSKASAAATAAGQGSAAAGTAAAAGGGAALSPGAAGSGTPTAGRAIGGGGGGGASAAAGAGGSSSLSAARPHADVWAALPNLEELLVEGQYAPNVCRGGRVMLSTTRG